MTNEEKAIEAEKIAEESGAKLDWHIAALYYALADDADNSERCEANAKGVK